MLRTLLFVALAFWPIQASAATFYVNDDGAHGANCTQYQSIGTPAATIVAGIACLSGGDTLLIRAGTYAEAIVPSTATIPPGTAGAYTKIHAYPGGCGQAGTCEAVTLAPAYSLSPSTSAVIWITSSLQYFEWDGIHMDCSDVENCLVFEPAITSFTINHTRWKDFTQNGPRTRCVDYPGGGCFGNGIFTNCTTCSGSDLPSGFNEFTRIVTHHVGRFDYQHAWYVNQADNVFDGLEIYDVTGSGIQIYASGFRQIPVRNIIRNTYIHDMTESETGGPGSQTHRKWGIIADGHNTVLYNNIIDTLPLYSGDTAKGIAISANDVLAYHNTIYNVQTGIEVADGWNGGTILRNNIVYATSTAISGSQWTGSNNSTSGSDPNFVNAVGGDFHLTAMSTADIDTGLCQGTVPTDKDGTARPQGPGCDRGAYEYVVAGSLPGIPTSLSPVSGATGVDLFTTLSFASTNATAYDFSISPYVGVSTASFQEFFTGVDSTDIGANWTPYGIGFTNAQRVNNRARNLNTTQESVEKVTGTTFAANQWCRMRLITFGTGYVSAACFFRLNNDAQPSGLFIGAAKGHASGYRSWAYRYTNGAYVFLGGEMVTPWAANDFLEAHVVGQTLTIYRNGNDALALTLTATDPTATYTAGTVGLYLFSSTLGQLEVDNFEAGDIGPVFQGTFSTATYSLSNAIPNTTYYWIPAGRNGQGVTEGSISTFTTVTSVAPTTPVGVRLRFISP